MMREYSGGRVEVPTYPKAQRVASLSETSKLGLTRGGSLELGENERNNNMRFDSAIWPRKTQPLPVAAKLQKLDETLDLTRCLILSVSDNGYGKRTDVDAYRLQTRGARASST